MYTSVSSVCVCVPYPVLLCTCREKRLREWKQEKVRVFSQHSCLADTDTAAHTTASQTGCGAYGPAHAASRTGNSSSSSSNASVASPGHQDGANSTHAKTRSRHALLCLLVSLLLLSPPLPACRPSRTCRRR